MKRSAIFLRTISSLSSDTLLDGLLRSNLLLLKRKRTKRKRRDQMKKLMMNEIPEHDRRRYGAALLEVLNQLRSDPETLAKIKARAAENERRRT